MRIAARRRSGFATGRRRTVEDLQARLEQLNLERQELRARSAGADALERNRLAIVDSQWDLSRALIDRYLAPQRTAA